MPFSRENNYFNRYDRSKRFAEWRNLAGEVPQAAELNEIQSLAADRVQRLGESMLQNGDVVSGMYVAPKRDGVDAAIGSARFYDADGGQIWIDGLSHDVEGGIVDLPVPTTGWGFIGVYLRKELITPSDVVDGPYLRDPAVHDSNGTPLGLPGANRLKVTPIWVAGTLPVSDFDDRKIQTMIGIHNSSDSFAPLRITVDTDLSVSTASLFNAKIEFPGNVDEDGVFTPLALTDLSQMRVRLGNRATPIAAQEGMILKAMVRGADLGATTVKASVNLFGAGGPKLTVAAGDIEDVTDASGNVELSLTLTSAMIAELGTDVNKCFLGIQFETDAGYFPMTTKLYISDLRAELPTDVRRPPYKLFQMANGVSYRSFVVGPAGFLRHGKSDNTVQDGSGQTNAQPASLDGVLVSALPQPTGVTGDPIIRNSVVTPEMEAAFLAEHGMTLEEGKLRIYPVHITFDGDIISTLDNREFTRLTDQYLSERLHAVIPDSTISGMQVLAVETAPGVYSGTEVDVSAGQAFVNGRQFAVEHPPRVTLPATVSNTIKKSPPETQSFDKPATAYTVLTGRFDKLTHVEVRVLFKETVTHVQSSLIGEAAFDTRAASAPDLSTLDVLRVNAATILKVQTDDFTFKEGLDWGLVKRVNNLNQEVSVIGWHNFDAQGGTRESKFPNNGATYTVYYEARLKLTVPAVGQTDSTHLKYVVDQNYNVAFNFDSKTTTTTLDGKTVYQLNDFSHADLGAALLGPYLVSGNFLIGSSSATDVAPTFKSTIDVYEYEATGQDGYIIYFSGNVLEDGPDGAFGFQTASSDLDKQEAAKHSLLGQKKLPLAFVKVPITDPTDDITQYNLRQITLAQQHATQATVQDVVKIMPVILSQMMVGGDFSLPQARLYEVAHADAAETRRLDLVQWKIDGLSFPSLSGYTVEVEYDYYTALEDPDLVGLLKESTATIKDATGAQVKRITTAFGYDPSTFDINDTQVSVS